MIEGEKTKEQLQPSAPRLSDCFGWLVALHPAAEAFGALLPPPINFLRSYQSADVVSLTNMMLSAAPNNRESREVDFFFFFFLKQGSSAFFVLV